MVRGSRDPWRGDRAAGVEGWEPPRSSYLATRLEVVQWFNTRGARQVLVRRVKGRLLPMAVQGVPSWEASEAGCGRVQLGRGFAGGEQSWEIFSLPWSSS